jgi:S-DNA-T family DNA segregation ATPase FtsK/SpoIIIE
MEKRYAIFAKVGVRNITGFNNRPKPRSQAELDALAAANGGEDDLFSLAQAKAAAEAAVAAATTNAPDTLATENDEDNIEAASDQVSPPASASDLLSGGPGSPDPFKGALNGDAEVWGKPESEKENEEAEQQALGIFVPRDSIIVPEKLPYIVIIVDELADLMQTAPADVEGLIARITQKARAAGIHMIVATQTPRADVVTGVIKANIPCRMAFQVASPLDSRVILDENGAERLLGQGDMLFRPPTTSRTTRVQGVFVTDDEVHRIVDWVSKQGTPMFESSIHERMQNLDQGSAEDGDLTEEEIDLVNQCIDLMRIEKKASTSFFQRRLRLGYSRAARVVDILEDYGYVGAGDGAKQREILRTDPFEL